MFTPSADRPTLMRSVNSSLEIESSDELDDDELDDALDEGLDVEGLDEEELDEEELDAEELDAGNAHISKLPKIRSFNDEVHLTSASISGRSVKSKARIICAPVPPASWHSWSLSM